jgi:putative ABC transport system permease protein
MMATYRTANRVMFWRIIRRLLGANRGRLFVILLALGTGAAVTAALFNLQIDAKRRLTTEFRSFGANVIIAPAGTGRASGSATISETLLDHFPKQTSLNSIPRAAFLYAIADVTAFSGEGTDGAKLGTAPVVIAGYRFLADDLKQIVPHHVIEGDNLVILDAETCEIGEKVASQFHLHVSGVLQVNTEKGEDSCVVSQIRSFGDAEDSQIFLPMKTVQRLAGLPQQVSLIQAVVPGTPAQIEHYLDDLRNQFRDAEVRPIRQFTEGETKIYNRISGLLTATVGIVLLLTGLCVMAAMTNVAMERKMDVGLMKAIGGSMRRVLRLFLAEAALLGLVGGLIGAALGIILSMGLGKAVFGVAARPRLIVYPVAVALTIMVAVLSAFPLRQLASIRPASVFRGEA